MKIYTIILYNQYGRWSATAPFETRQEAERHADSYFRTPDKEYYMGITFLEVTLPAYPEQKERGTYSHSAEA